MTARCLFTAPSSFMPDIREEYRSVLPTIFETVWDRDELTPSPDVNAWVPNPGQNFVIDGGVLREYPNLRLIVTPSTGRNHIDVRACEERGIGVYSLLDNRGKLSTITASAEFTFLLMLNTLRRLDVAVTEVSEGRWRRREDRMRGNEIQGRTVGLVGLGRIGGKVARYCDAFGAEVAYHDPHVKVDLPSISLEKLFATSDIVVICCVLTPETEGMIQETLLASMKENACLVNTARGEIIVEQDLVTVLEARPDLRVGLDVLQGEVRGTQYDSPLIPLHEEGRVTITPHIAGLTLESQKKAAAIALSLLRDHLEDLRDIR